MKFEVSLTLLTDAHKYQTEVFIQDLDIPWFVFPKHLLVHLKGYKIFVQIRHVKNKSLYI